MVTVEGSPGKGSSSPYLPSHGEKAAMEYGSSATERLIYAGQRVLYVDDVEALVFLAHRVFQRLGCSISGFTDPQAALAAFRADPQDFDIVVTDLSMPHMSGFDLAREVLELRPGMPVLMTTGCLWAGDQDRARAAGVRELLLKPVTVSELSRVLARMFHGGESSAKRPL